MLKRINRACRFFPCHTGLEDCTFCYCPFYPCLDEKKGGFVYSDKNKKGVWSCESCGWIHERKVTEGIFDLIRKSGLRAQKLKNGKRGVIIFSHGSKLKKANSGLNKTIAMVRRKTGMSLIVPAYLQFCRLDLEKSVKYLIRRGCETILVVPFFLLKGNHATRDLPRIIEKEKARYPNVNFLYTKNLGADARIADIVSDMIGEALEK